jgi:Spx/MgsR family transcriptional regulator
MTNIELYGLANCDTVKKARVWLESHGLEYTFHDYKKAGADPGKVAAWIAAAGLDAVVNRKGTTFRKLTPAEQADSTDSHRAVALLVQHTSVIKRPIVEHAGGVLVGFKEDEWRVLLG